MSPALKRTEIQELVNKFARQSPENRQALLEDPKGVIERLTGASLGSLEVKAVSETDDASLVVVVPYRPAADEMEPADLDTVTGGAGSVGYIRISIFDARAGDGL